MTAREKIPQKYAAKLQLAMIAGSEPATSLFEIRSKRLAGGGMDQTWIPVRDLDRAVSAITNRGQMTDVYVGAAPRVREGGTAQDVERVWCLWADLDTPDAVEAARSFRPLPSIVLRSGTPGRMHAWWPLSAPLSPGAAELCNRRLALALGADRASTDAARIMRPCNSLSHKHNPPAPVECVRLECDAFKATEIIGGLADDPMYAPRAALPPVRSIVNGGNALAGLVRVVREAHVENRNNSLNWAAFHAGAHVMAGTHDASEAEYALLSAATDAGLPEREAQRTIMSGLTAGGRQAA
jgi:hypothetical protein